MPQVLKTELIKSIISSLENVQILPLDNEKGRLVYLLHGSHAYLNIG